MENQLKDLLESVYDNDEKLGKSSVKLLALCIMLRDVNWELVDKFVLKWEVVEVGGIAKVKMPLPVVYLSVGGGEEKTFVGDEDELEK
ncbi:MAG: hypothetical protein ACTSWJ_02285 [Candidatus Heimdallarchaeaceae archaeon]